MPERAVTAEQLRKFFPEDDPVCVTPCRDYSMRAGCSCAAAQAAADTLEAQATLLREAREALSAINAERYKDRETVDEHNAWPAWQRQNARMVAMMDRARDTLAKITARLDGSGDGWQPIASAPKGEWLITFRAGESGATTAMQDEEGDWHSPDGRTTWSHHSYAAPTHWQPFPAPPRSDTGKEGA